eukprot:1154143-Pelagomonas_calceolata.AAC.2
MQCCGVKTVARILLRLLPSDCHSVPKVMTGVIWSDQRWRSAVLYARNALASLLVRGPFPECT